MANCKSDRAISPALGVVLLVGITIALAATTAAFALDMGDSLSEPDLEPDADAPSATFEATETRSSVIVEHTGGDELAAERVTVAGEPWGDGEIEEGDRITVDERGPVVWSDGDREVVLAELEG